MPRRLALSATLACFSALLLAALAWTQNLNAADTPPSRIAFQIATGSTAGTFFPVGEAIAGLISHPPGVGRCDRADVCGPAGLVMSARTSEGAVDNLMAVNRGDVDSGLAQSDVTAAAVRGSGPFQRLGAQKHIRVIASLFAEDVHLVASAKSKIKSVADLRGKRVGLGGEGSGVDVTAREILAAYGVRESGLKTVHADVFDAAAAMAAGKLDAFFAVGGVPVDGLSDLLRSGAARLVPIDGAGRDRLLRGTPSLSAAVIAADVYPGSGAVPTAVPTVAARALWIVRDSVPDALVYDITRALFNPRNYAALAASHPSAREIGLATAALSPPAPLHPGAARFYRARSAIALRYAIPSAISCSAAFSQSCIAGSAQTRAI